MKQAPLIVFIVLLVAIIAVILVFYFAASPYISPPNNATSTASGTSSSTPFGTVDQSISDGTATIHFPSNDFGLATNQTQILVHPYIPPCESNFDYCIYYIGNAYQGTNFESAGIRYEKRADLTTERLCLQTPPTGYDSTFTPNATSSADQYSTSVFANVGGAAAGHFAAGSLYRLFYRPSNTCYEFETRIGQSAYANYPSGSIQEFTAADQAALQSELQQILGTLTLPQGVAVSFPAVAQTNP